jgi:hypothetical protein
MPQHLLLLPLQQLLPLWLPPLLLQLLPVAAWSACLQEVPLPLLLTRMVLALLLGVRLRCGPEAPVVLAAVVQGHCQAACG